MLSKETVVVVIATPDRRRDIPVHNKLSRLALCQIPSPQDDNLFLNDCQPIHEQGILLPERYHRPASCYGGCPTGDGNALSIWLSFLGHE